MAYLRQNDDEEDQNGQPKLAPGAGSGGGWFSGGSSGFGSQLPQQQTQTPQQKSGSGSFTNFQSWLDAGKDRSQSLSSGGASALGAAKSSFGKVADDANSKLESAPAAWTFDDGEAAKDVGAVGRGGTIGMTHLSNGGWIDDKIFGKGDPLERLKGSVIQGYNGPTSIGWDAGQSDDMRKLDALSGTATAGAQLAGDTPYSAGARRMDQALFGGDAASQTAIGANKTGANAFLTDVGAQKDAFTGKVADKVKSYDDANTKNRGELQRLFDFIGGQAKRQEKTAQRDEATLAGQQAPTGFTSTYTAGSPITAGNTIGTEQAGWMKTLGDILGQKSIGKTGDYTRGTTTRDALPPPPSTTREGVKWLTPEQLKSSWAGKDPVFVGNNDYGQGAWVDENGNLLRGGGNSVGALSGYDYDSSTGEYIDIQTGEHIKKTDVDNGWYQFDGQTGKLTRNQQQKKAHF